MSKESNNKILSSLIRGDVIPYFYNHDLAVVVICYYHCHQLEQLGWLPVEDSVLMINDDGIKYATALLDNGYILDENDIKYFMETTKYRWNPSFVIEPVSELLYDAHVLGLDNMLKNVEEAVSELTDREKELLDGLSDSGFNDDE